jgi:uncharacterized protein
MAMAMAMAMAKVVEKPRSTVVRAVKIAIGILLIPLGIAGLFLPVLQGVLFLLLAFVILASEIPFVARLRDRLAERYPEPFDRADRLGARLKDWSRERFRRGDSRK